ncbi:hypothetical protein FQR65_LT20291 [Abscondita terminalis]|nr:hypothetical protein FQR65_LT20291 [Abscondita terminalis]
MTGIRIPVHCAGRVEQSCDAKSKHLKSIGYSAVQVAFGRRRASRVNQSQQQVTMPKAGVEAGTTALKEFPRSATAASRTEKLAMLSLPACSKFGQKVDVPNVSLSVKARRANPWNSSSLNDQGQAASNVAARILFRALTTTEAADSPSRRCYQANARSGNRKQKDREKVHHTTKKAIASKRLRRARLGKSRLLVVTTTVTYTRHIAVSSSSTIGVIDFKPTKTVSLRKVERILITIQTARPHIALVLYADGERSIHHRNQRYAVGDQLMNGSEAAESNRGKGAQMAVRWRRRSVMAREGAYAQVRLRSVKWRRVHIECRAPLAKCNAEHSLPKSVRQVDAAGVVFVLPFACGHEPGDHPHGGGKVKRLAALKKVLRSSNVLPGAAIANAEHNDGADIDELKVTTIIVEKGVTMGQKIHPTGFRLAVSRNWASRWYAGNSNFATMLNEDLKVRAYLKTKLKNASVGRVVIERPAKNARITIYSSRPGVVIGKKGEDIEVVKSALTQNDGVCGSCHIEENSQLGKRIHVRRAMKRAMQNAMRLVAPRMVSRRSCATPTPLRADIDYGFGEAEKQPTASSAIQSSGVYKGDRLANGEAPVIELDRSMTKNVVAHAVTIGKPSGRPRAHASRRLNQGAAAPGGRTAAKSVFGAKKPDGDAAVAAEKAGE